MSDEIQSANAPDHTDQTPRFGSEATGQAGLKPSGAVPSHSQKDRLLSFFIPDLTVGGAEQVTVNIVNGLSDRGYNITLLLSRFDGELDSRLAADVDVTVLPPSRTSVFGAAAHLPSLVTYLRRERPVALFPHLTQVSVVALAAARLVETDTLVIPTHHSAFGTSAGRTARDVVLQQLTTRLYPLADRVITVSEGVADSIVAQTAVDRNDISVLYNPVEVETVRDQGRDPVEHEWIEDDETRVLLSVGRIAQQKDLKTWLRVFNKVHEQNPRVRGVLAGKGPQREEVMAFADRLGIGDVVSMPGYVQNPYGFMHRSDVFLLSSKFEGLPTVLVEALACGCPVVSTDCPSGPREILDDGRYGHLVPVSDIDGLASAVEQTLEEPIPADRLWDRANDFAPESILNDYERFLAEHVFSRR